jgi:hypothetical protein
MFIMSSVARCNYLREPRLRRGANSMKLSAESFFSSLRASIGCVGRCRNRDSYEVTEYTKIRMDAVPTVTMH